ncbi:MAG TPA: hypothetical protein VEL11_19215, partial [Candidatus Bathyarchaeia archaeon]|nr:hypothetical protein [Candidatus Bathyarchaeia archaeon]
ILVYPVLYLYFLVRRYIVDYIVAYPFSSNFVTNVFLIIMFRELGILGLSAGKNLRIFLSVKPDR